MVKNTPAKAWNTRDSGSIPGSGRYPGRGNGNPLQYSCLENPMDRGAWQATVHGVAKSWTRLNVWTHLNTAQQSVMGSFLLPVMISGTYMITNPSFNSCPPADSNFSEEHVLLYWLTLHTLIFQITSFIMLLLSWGFNSYPPRAFFSALRSPGLKELQ